VGKIWATIFQEDAEACDIWVNEVGIDPGHIVRLGKEDNFWEHGSGPCGPCSEIYFDRGPEYGCGSPDCKPGCDCDRYMEFWNNVFTQFDNDGHGNYSRLAKPNIDTGMGLERLACIMQGVDNLFEVDTVRNIMFAVCDIAGVKYGQDKKTDISLRVITDHIRSTTFLVCDGVVPSNEGRGYVLRRLLRRAARHGKMLGINHTFLADLVDVVARENLSEYPELTEKLDYIKKIIAIEEDRFAATIDAGLAILSGITDKAVADGTKVISGADVFKLYDTFGFPVDLTREILSEKGLEYDESEFVGLMNDQKQRARSARANISGWNDASKTLLSDFAKTEFVGYTQDECAAGVIGIIADDMNVNEVTEGDFTVILDKTVFYGEGGGQVGDSGTLMLGDIQIDVRDTKKSDGVYAHICSMTTGTLSVGDTVTAKIDTARRDAIRRNHSTCHMLQAALRLVLGKHVEQAGSYVDEDRLRFDFSHYAPMTADEIKAVEDTVNAHILAGEAITTTETDVETAKKNGAMALFGEKYGSVVRMVKMGEFSTELCGGTHLDNTAKAGLFKIISESSVAAGVRRIEGTTGLGVLKYYGERDALIADTAKELKSTESEIVKHASMLQSELKNARSEIASLEAKIAQGQLASISDGAVKIGAFNVITSRADGVTLDAIRNICDDIKAKDTMSITVIGTVTDGKLNFVCACGADAVKAGAHAGKIVKSVASFCGGSGGGRPDSATAGGKDTSRVDEALASVKSVIESL
ncbi:MAG: alanine--tRNA ligase, partial [Clostridia bacterium]|nr:alanine--tRNA ligase [Clostridia bacterium]